MLSSKELVYETLAFNKVPRVPYAIGFTVLARQALLAAPGGREAFKQISNDLIMSPVIRIEFGVSDSTGHYVDEFGVDWDRRMDPDIGIPHPVLTPETLAAFRWPDARAEGRFDILKKHLRQFPEKFHIMDLDFSLYERAWSLRGMENLFMDMLDNEPFVADLLDKVLTFNLDVIAAGLDECPGIDGVYFGDDFGSQTGMLMGAGCWRRLIKPRLAKQYAAVRSRGKKVFIHSCGKVQEIFDDLVEIGVNCFNPFQPEVMDVFDLLRRYHGKLAFHGGVSTQQLLPYGSVQQVEEQIDRLLAAGRNGGYIIAPAHATPGDAKPENIIAMLGKVCNQ